MNVTILARVGEFDVELAIEVNDASEIAGMCALLVANGIGPRPRFQKTQVAMPFEGQIVETRTVPAKDGKKEFCQADVKSPEGEIVSVRYFPPQKTWRAGEKVIVQKGAYGPELKEVETQEPPF